MIARRISLKQRLSTSATRFLFPSTHKASSPLSPSLVTELGRPSLGVFFLRRFCSNASESFQSINNSIDSRIRCKVNKCCFSTHALADLPVGGIVDVPLAQTGEGIAECELLKWFVRQGDEVEEFQPLCEVQSDKATIEITSRYKGKVAQILSVPGDVVKVGETLLKIIVEECQAPTQMHDGSEDKKSVDPKLEKIHIGGVLSTPAVRNLAKQYNINLNDVHGNGKDGRILKEDVLKYGIQKGVIEESPGTVRADSGNQCLGEKEKYSDASAEIRPLHEDKIVPLRGFQRTMVKTMSMAARVPHFHYVEEINCNTLVELKASFQNNNPDPGVKHTFLPLLIKSLSMALNKYPWLNSSFNEETVEVILKGSHNIGIAMATPHGLVVPNIKDVQSLSILEITKELARLQQLASENKLNPEDITGGTITLSNIGAIGGKFGAPILNLPEVAIIAIGRIQKVPQFADDGNVYPAFRRTKEGTEMATASSGIQKLLQVGTKIVAVGRNYAAHAKELGNAVPKEPVLFLKPTSSYLENGGTIEIPHPLESLDHEVELAVVINKKARDVPQTIAMDYVGGYALALDMTAREIQASAKSAGLPWSVAKGQDTFTPISSVLPKSAVPDPDNLELWLKVDGDIRQKGSTKDMIFKIPYLISHISSIMTLFEGDIILTGTPQGVGPVKVGQKITAGITDLIDVHFNVENRRRPGSY